MEAPTPLERAIQTTAGMRCTNKERASEVSTVNENVIFAGSLDQLQLLLKS